MLHIPRLVLKQPMTLLNLTLLLMLYGRLPPMKSGTQWWQGAPVSIAVAMPTGNAFVLQLSSHSLRSLRSTDKADGGHPCSQAAIYQAADLHKQPGITCCHLSYLKMASLNCLAAGESRQGVSKTQVFSSNDSRPSLWAGHLQCEQPCSCSKNLIRSKAQIHACLMSPAHLVVCAGK